MIAFNSNRAWMTGLEMLEPLILMTSRDLLFAIGFFDVNPSLQCVLDYAVENQCPVVLLTDTLGSIIGDKADIILSAKRGSVYEFHLLVVPMTIINTLLFAVAQEERPQSKATTDSGASRPPIPEHAVHLLRLSGIIWG